MKEYNQDKAKKLMNTVINNIHVRLVGTDNIEKLLRDLMIHYMYQMRYVYTHFNDEQYEEHVFDEINHIIREAEGFNKENIYKKSEL